eukprot:TRINITY_DN19422_c0_g1_i1.p1 TRINITY_DN19422_c0_g1~~TRINITY_DN19422_c0_g1_i1.p1  ORF type:complete len:466 (+),score=93.09 TRINITY_DN19422_c0_g1_i1:1-1398(+)
MPRIALSVLVVVVGLLVHTSHAQRLDCTHVWPPHLTWKAIHASVRDVVVEDERRAFVTDQLREWNAHMPPEKLNSKYCKMAVTDFTFMRGVDHLWWADMGYEGTMHSKLSRYGGTMETRAWVQADAHPTNIGAFHNSRGRVVLDLNDFDEAVRSDYQMDLWRLAVGAILVGRGNELSEDHIQESVEKMVKKYARIVASGKIPDPVMASDDSVPKIIQKFLEDVKEENTRKKMIKRWTKKRGSDREFDDDLAKLGHPDAETEKALRRAFARYCEARHDPLVAEDVALRLLAGIGSHGVDRYYVLATGGSIKSYAVLDVKEVSKPAPWAYLSRGEIRDTQASFDDGNHAQRVIAATKAFSSHVDPYLGWLTMDGMNFTVRERSPWKESFPLETLKDHSSFTKAAKTWGRILAAGHMRHAQKLVDFFSDHIDDSSWLDEFTHYVWDISQEYAVLVRQDYRAFLDMLDE